MVGAEEADSDGEGANRYHSHPRSGVEGVKHVGQGLPDLAILEIRTPAICQA